MAVNADVSAIFYLVGGYRRSACYSRQREFFQVDPTSPVFHVDEYLDDELGISQQDLIAAFHRIPEGAVLWKFTGNS